MGRFNHIRRVTHLVGGRTITFRSLFEYHYCVWLQLQKEQSLILDWWYEDEIVELEQEYSTKPKKYLPDFTVQMLDGSYEFEETKGYFPSKDYTKLRLYADQYDTPLTLIFASTPYGSQKRRAERIEKHIKRVIYDAEKSIFTKISFLFDE